MERILLTPRDNLSSIAEEYGFDFYIIEGEKYWDESRAYAFTLEQIEKDIEDPTNELHGMLLKAVDVVVNSPERLIQFDIPETAWDAVRRSWNDSDLSVYGRLDLRYDGKGPAKLLEANYDTPTSLFEAAVFQWDWLEDRIANGVLPKNADQFNSLHEKLINAWAAVKNRYGVTSAHFAGVLAAPEDKYTLQYMMDTAVQAGLASKLLDITRVGIGNRHSDGAQVFTDEQDKVIECLFKLYPYEHMFREDFSKFILKSATGFVEPAWKAVISNKAILALLWEMFPGHPNLLPAYFTETKGYVRKAFFSREGTNIVLPTGESTEAEEYQGGFVWQEFSPLPSYGSGDYPVIGSWVVGGEAAGIGIREDNSLITKNTSRFVPHFIR